MRTYLIVIGILGLLFGFLLFLTGFASTDIQLGMGLMTILLASLCLGLASVIRLLSPPKAQKAYERDPDWDRVVQNKVDGSDTE